MTATRLDLATIRRRAVRSALPVFLPAFPFGFVLGLAMSESAMPTPIAAATSPIVFAGAAQLALVSLVGPAGVWAALATAMVVNARHVMYSAALAPAFSRQPMWFRALGPFALIDQVFALSVPRVDDDPEDFRTFYLATCSVFYLGWQVVTGLGLAFGSVIPENWQLGYAPAVMFVGLVVIALDRRPGVVAAVVGAVVCFAAIGLPNRTGLLLGGFCGVVAGVIAERAAAREERRGS